MVCQTARSQVARVEQEFNKGWIEENLDQFYRKVFDFHQQYSSDYSITVDNSRTGFVKFIANQKEMING